jgi:outer membrane immunogenic protein
MKKIAGLLAVAGVASLASMQVNAQSSFEGAYGQLGIGFQSVSPSVSNVSISGSAGGTTLTNFPLSSSVGSSNNFTGTATLGYNFGVTKDFLLGIGAEYSPFASTSSNVTANYGPDSSGAWYRATSSFQIENSYNIFLSPAIAIDKDKLAYAKIGYTGASAKTAAQTVNLNGYSLGLGYKQMISGGWYGFGEVNYAAYGNQNISSNYNSVVIVGGTTYNVPTTAKATVSANTMNVLVGVGYKF